MHCKACPIFPFVEAVVDLDQGKSDNPLLPHALSRFEELRKRCISCHKRAAKNDSHFGPDRDGGRLHGEIGFDEELFSPGLSQRSFSAAPEWLAQRAGCAPSGCTASLAPDAEDALRKAVAVVVAEVEVADAPVLLSLLKREPLTVARKATRKQLNRREFCASVRRALKALDKAKRELSVGDKETRKAADKLVETLGSSLTTLDAPILLGLLRGLSIAAIGRAAGLHNRATAHLRLTNLLRRLPQLKPLHSSAKKA